MYAIPSNKLLNNVQLIPVFIEEKSKEQEKSSANLVV